MKSDSREVLRRGFRIAVQAFLIAAAMNSAQASSQQCKDLYGAIKIAAMYCGFFCDQNELQPLQVAYAARCIVAVIPDSALGFDSSPEPAPSVVTIAESRLQPIAFLQPARRNSQHLIEILQEIGSQQFWSKSQRMLLAAAVLDYCTAALARVPYKGARVGLTEESGDRSDATLEFSQWRLSSIFGDCTETAHWILDAKEVQHETDAWIRFARFLEQDETVRQLSIRADVRPLGRSRAETGDIFGTENWRNMRTIVLDRVRMLPRGQ